MRLREFGAGIVALFAWTVAIGDPTTDPGVPFVENKRQWPATFQFGAEFSEARVYFDHRRIFFIQFTQRSDGKKGPPDLPTGFSEADHLHHGRSAMATFEMEFVGAATRSISGVGQHVTLYNYFLGNDTTRWASGAHAFDAVQYKQLYAGIDLVVYSENGLMKSDWIVSPCADPSQIVLKYNGVEDLQLLDGRLHVTGRLGDVTEEKPFAYQYVNGVKRNIACEYVLKDHTVSFRFPDGYDSNYEVVIDPILIFSSYSGSKSDNWGNTATPDAFGNLYSGGIVYNEINPTGFPVTAGAYQTFHRGGEWDVGILKYDSIGANLLYVTLLGGSGVETPQSLVVNKKDELLILGATSSFNFPGISTGTFKGGQGVQPLEGINYAAGTDIFITRLSSNGTQLRSSRLVGGTGNDAINFISGIINGGGVESPLGKNYGDQLRGDITVDADDNVYIATNTRSADFPVINSGENAAFHGGSHDGVIAKFTPDLSTLLWSRLIGGSGTDVALSVKISKDGRLYVAGGTNSTDMAGMNGYIKTAPGGINGWIMELNPYGVGIINGTYLGTASYDQIYFIDIGTEGDIFAYGQTSGSYPIHPIDKVFSNPGGKQFLHKLTGDLTASVFSTVFGSGRSGPDISPTAFLVNDCNNIYMAGWGGYINSRTPNYVGGNTTNLPITSDAFQPVTFAGNDFYMIVLTGDVELVYATYLGGTTSPTHVDGGTSRFDKRGIVYHAVCAGCHGNSDFPAFGVPASRSTNGSSKCNNAAFKFDLSSLKAKVQSNNVQLTAAGLTRVCIPDPIVFQNRSVGGEIFKWDLGDGTKFTRLQHDTVKHYYKKPGSYTVKLTAIDASTCIGIDSTSLVVTVALTNMSAAADRTICYGTSTRLDAFGAVLYDWKGDRNGFTSKEKSPLVSPEESERYFITMTDISGCQRKDTINVNVVPGIDLQFEVETITDCTERPQVLVRDNTELKEDEDAFFSFGDGTGGQGPEETHQYEHDGLYTITLIGRKAECTYESSVQVPVVTVQVPNVITPADSPDKNDFFKVVVGNPGSLRESIQILLTVYNRWGEQVYRSSDYKDDWNASNVEEGVYYYDVEIVGQTQCKGWVHVIK